MKIESEFIDVTHSRRTNLRCHPRESGDPALSCRKYKERWLWVPAFAGTTEEPMATLPRRSRTRRRRGRIALIGDAELLD
ncbi:hypothetical protein, partial [Klebsiella aerogenes]|uniref:hypothetical protein n=1 Tax=Klebsiella aerogenes TaxID=548 RepID=UPI0019541BF1